jgi:twitching motility protein PilJ
MAFKLKLPDFSKTKQSGKADVSMGSVPVIGHLPFNQQLKLLIGGVVISLLVSIAAAVLDFRTIANGAHYLKLSGDLVMLTQRVAKDAGSVLQGKQTAIDGLPQARGDVERILNALENGDETAPSLGGEPRASLDKLLPIANQHLGYIKNVEGGRAALVAISRALDAGKKVIPQLHEELGQSSLSGEKGLKVAKLDTMLDRIDSQVNALMSGMVTAEHFDILKTRMDSAELLLAGLDQSNPAVAKLLNTFNGYRDTIRAVIALGQNWVTAKQESGKYFDGVSGTKHGLFLVGSQGLQSAIQDSLTGRWTTYLLVLSAALLLLFLALLVSVFLADARQRASKLERVNMQTQSAILRLMNELGDLADGDLTVRATVTEDITGAIADSVNATTEELQRLVSRIVAAAEQMRLSTSEAESVSKNLLEATQKQVREIQDAGDSVQLMSRSIREVDAAANKAAEVGRHTLATTGLGAQAVRNTISGMDGIREQIQETSKRIKRLGESSQEIGEIVDLISDITEQTNVLALNAAIQAVSAGEAGRGFSVVAEEVQRLAERSADATRKISGLVKTIQSDTHDAVAAMEKSTLGVVEGAKLSDMAGQSLKEIGLVSNELAALINSISVSTQMQTDMADEVASAMQGILKITEQTTEGTRQTAHSVAQLTTIASDLKGSVAGFKL